MSQYKILGINDDTDTCEVCGKTHLKRVVWLEDIEGGIPFAAGTTCAARLMGKGQKKGFLDYLYAKAQVIEKVKSMMRNHEIPLPLRPAEYRKAGLSRESQASVIKKADKLLQNTFNKGSQKPWGLFPQVSMRWRFCIIGDDTMIDPDGNVRIF